MIFQLLEAPSVLSPRLQPVGLGEVLLWAPGLRASDKTRASLSRLYVTDPVLSRGSKYSIFMEHWSHKSFRVCFLERVLKYWVLGLSATISQNPSHKWLLAVARMALKKECSVQDTFGRLDMACTIVVDSLLKLGWKR